MKSQLLKRADILNEELARPDAGRDDIPSSDYVNPFCTKKTEENIVQAQVEIHETPKMLPPRPEARKHVDEDQIPDSDSVVENPRLKNKPKTSAPLPDFQEILEMSKSLNPMDARLLKLIVRMSGKSIADIMQFSGIPTSQRFVQTLNNMAHKGWLIFKDQRPIATDLGKGLVMALDGKKPGTVVSKMNFRSHLLRVK